MRIEYQISEDDFVNAARLAMRKRSAFAGYRIYLWPVLGAVLILFGTIAAIGKREVSGLWPVVLWGSILLALPMLWGFQFRRVYRKSPMLQDRRTLEIDNTSRHFTSPSSDGRTGWHTYIKFAESNETFILFQQGNQIFIPVPKRELSPLQIDELRSLFETHLPRK
ncbi:MAG: hypothetical protein JWQ49_6727 [Edaphobacter sp.]|nr:hypothetical protein [Edaphobacter sp.]